MYRWSELQFMTREELQKAYIERYGEELCRKIFNDPNDVSYMWYRELFSEKAKEWHESKETKTQGNIDSNSNS